jgi:hypothetical protein
MHWIGKVRITKIVELETVGTTRFILPPATHEEIRKLPRLIPQFAADDERDAPILAKSCANAAWPTQPNS